MARSGPVSGLYDLLFHRLVANFWLLPLLAIILAPLIAHAGFWLDRAFVSPWLVHHRLFPVASSDTAKDFAAASIGIDVALLALYISITLIVLTLAAGNLGVRLVDRWLDKPLIRIMLSVLVFCLVYSLALLMNIDSKASLDQLPLGSIWLAYALQLVNLAMLAVAAHDLGRTMYVDRAIAHLGEEAANGGISVVGGKSCAQTSSEPWRQRIDAPREGYVEGMDLAGIATLLGAHTRARFVAPPGRHVLRGEPLLLLGETCDAPERLVQAIPIGDYRTSAQNAVFHVRLLVEIGARALSPGINDFYTAISCADKLACAMLGQADSWVDDGQVPVSSDYPRFELPGQDFRGLFAAPLKAFRQAAASNPAVAVRMITNYARVAALTTAPQLRYFLETQARELAEHAAMQAELAADTAAISGCIADWQDAADNAEGTRAQEALDR